MIRLHALGRARFLRGGDAIATGSSLVLNCAIVVFSAVRLRALGIWWWWAALLALAIAVSITLTIEGRKPDGGAWLRICGLGAAATLAGFAAVGAFVAAWFWVYQ